jgi:Chalcone isomerase-like
MKKMKKIILLMLAFAIIPLNLFSQKDGEVDGVTIPRTVKFSNKEIILNGVGVRSKFIFDVYTQALYLTNLSNDPNEIINSNSTMGMIFYMTSPLVTAKKFSRNLDAGMRKTVGDEKWLSFKTELAKMEELVSLDKIVKNDVFNLIYNDVDSSIWVIKNGVVKGKIPGFEFKKAFFGIWLSDKPVKESLKNNLLGIKN